MTDFIIGTIVVIIFAAAITYIIKEKKKGTRCIGCLAAGTCGKRHLEGGCSGHSNSEINNE